MAVGSYTGDGTSYHQITGIKFNPTLVWIWTESQFAVWASPVTDGKTLYFSSATASFTTGITGFLPDGFIVGNHATVNTAGQTYYYQAFRDNGAGDFDVGAYIGDGVDNKVISSVGFQPDFVVVKGDTAQSGSYKFTGA